MPVSWQMSVLVLVEGLQSAPLKMLPLVGRVMQSQIRSGTPDCRQTMGMK